MIETVVSENTIQQFQLRRLKRAVSAISVFPEGQRLAAHAAYSLYRACITAGVKREADEILASHQS